MSEKSIWLIKNLFKIVLWIIGKKSSTPLNDEQNCANFSFHPKKQFGKNSYDKKTGFLKLGVLVFLYLFLFLLSITTKSI